jgi:hypothetical protein
MEEAGTGGNSWPLKSASGENPTVTQGKPITFLFTDLPPMCPSGPLANYLSGCFLTIAGTLTQPSEGGTPIPRDVLPGLFIDSIDWTQSFFGAVVSTNYFKGKFLPVMEYQANGFKYAQHQAGAIPVNGAFPFSFTVWVPAASDRRGRLISATSQLALLFQPSQCKINFAGASALDDFSDGATASNLTCRLTADLDPRQELVMGTPMEWVLHEIAAAGSTVKIEGFGRNTAFTGVEEKGGVAFLGELTGNANQDGIIIPEDISQISFQWRGQGELQDIIAWVNKFSGLMPNDRPQQGGVTPGTNTSPALNDFDGFPYTMSRGDLNAVDIDLVNLRFFPWVMGGRELRLTDLQTAQQDQTAYVTQSTPFSGTHQIVAQYARQWQVGKRAAWESLVRGSGLLEYCYGNAGAASAKMVQRIPLSKHYTTPDQQTYLPFALQP